LASGKILSTIEVNSYKNLHKKFARATPEMWLKYELAISLYDLHASKHPLSDDNYYKSTISKTEDQLNFILLLPAN
jgi:hypothetical protein